MCKKSATKIFTINRNILFKLIGRFYIVQSYTFLNIQNDIIRLHVFLINEFMYTKVAIFCEIWKSRAKLLRNRLFEKIASVTG